MGKPVITAVNGVCAGGGLHWVADADIVIASSDATFVDPHVSIGQVSALETIALMRKMPAEAVLRMALVGSHERLTAQRAYELGMISQVVDPPEKLRDVAQELAREDRQEFARRDARHEARALGGARIRAHRRLPRRREAPDVDVGPPRPERGAAGVRRQAISELASTGI